VEVSSAPVAARARPVLPDVVAEHLEEYGFLLLQRRKLLFAPDFAARRLGDHDERAAAHWAGLEVNLPDSARLAEEALEAAEDPWALVSAARAWLALARPGPDAVLARWADLEPEPHAAWRETLRGLNADVLERAVPPARRRGLPAPALALLADALAWQGDAALAREAATHEHAFVRARAARALGFGEPNEDDAPIVRALAADADPSVARRALWCLTRFDREAALAHARRLGAGATPEPFALRVLGLLGARDDQTLLAAAAATDSGRPAAFNAMGDLGTDEAIEALIRLLQLPDPPMAKIVTDALETAIGRIARKDAEAPATPVEARAAWDALEAPSESRLMHGQPRPWSGAKSEEPMLWRWRGAIRRPRGAAAELAREVPDGFFDPLPTLVTIPGE
jgi:hypothetical protein